jgi:hypothetical protein
MRETWSWWRTFREAQIGREKPAKLNCLGFWTSRMYSKLPIQNDNLAAKTGNYQNSKLVPLVRAVKAWWRQAKPATLSIFQKTKISENRQINQTEDKPRIPKLPCAKFPQTLSKLFDVRNVKKGSFGNGRNSVFHFLIPPPFYRYDRKKFRLIENCKGKSIQESRIDGKFFLFDW